MKKQDNGSTSHPENKSKMVRSQEHQLPKKPRIPNKMLSKRMEIGIKMLTEFGKIVLQVKHSEVKRPKQVKLMPKIQKPTQKQKMIPNQKATGNLMQSKMHGSTKLLEKNILLEIRMMAQRLNPKKMEIGIKMLMEPGSIDRQVKKLEAKRPPLTLYKKNILTQMTVRSHGLLMRRPMNGWIKLLGKELQTVRRRKLSKRNRRLVRKTHGPMMTQPSSGSTQKLEKHGQTMEKLSKKQ